MRLDSSSPMSQYGCKQFSLGLPLVRPRVPPLILVWGVLEVETFGVAVLGCNAHKARQQLKGVGRSKRGPLTPLCRILHQPPSLRSFAGSNTFKSFLRCGFSAMVPTI